MATLSSDFVMNVLHLILTCILLHRQRLRYNFILLSRLHYPSLYKKDLLYLMDYCAISKLL